MVIKLETVANQKYNLTSATVVCW